MEESQIIELEWWTDFAIRVDLRQFGGGQLRQTLVQCMSRPSTPLTNRRTIQSLVALGHFGEAWELARSRIQTQDLNGAHELHAILLRPMVTIDSRFLNKDIVSKFFRWVLQTQRDLLLNQLLRGAMLIILPEIEKYGVLNDLMSICMDQNHTLRGAAMIALRPLAHGSDVRSFLLTAARNKFDPQRSEAVFALEPLAADDLEVRALLFEVANNRSDPAREAALSAFGWLALEDAEITELLLRIAEDDDPMCHIAQELILSYVLAHQFDS